MTPLAATVAATVALGVGMAIAKAGRERSARARKRDRRFALRGGEPLSEGLQRVALGQIDLVLETLDDGGEGRRKRNQRAVHETRKALKRLRALVGILRDELGEEEFTRESEALRDIARRLAPARDSEVLLDTLDGLIARHPRKLGRRKGVRRLRKQLMAERRATEVDELTRTQVLADLRLFRTRVEGWRLPDRRGILLIEPGLRRCYREGRRGHRRALHGKGDRSRTMHAWRKHVKDLRYAAELLRDRRLAARADQLAELLGNDHDLALLEERVRTRRHSSGRSPRRATRKLLLKRIARRRRKLRRRALRDGERLYRRRPKRFLARLRRG